MLKMKILILAVLGVVIGTTIAMVVVGQAAPSNLPLLAPVETGFTYQGYLEDSGGPANGSYTLRFGLYEVPTGGSMMTIPQTIAAVPVVEGRFTVTLDFGGVFDGTAYWLEIEVQGLGDPGYTTLIPRQPLAPVPYASFASHAAWDGLNGVPAGFADGIDDEGVYSAGTGLELVGDEFRVETGYRLPQVCSSNDVATWNGVGWQCAIDHKGVTQVYNGDGLDRLASGSEVTLSADFAGSGTATTVARSDHTHSEFTTLDSRLSVLETENPVLGEHHDTPTNDGINVIDYPFTFDISGLGPDVEPSNVRVVASGFKKASDGTPEAPIMIRWEVSGTTLTLRVWESGTEFSSQAPIPPPWQNRRVELDFIVIRGE